MRKTIIKTALFTALSLIFALFLGAFSIFVFAPSLSAKISYDLGMKNLSTSCYERVYHKTGELDDLIAVIDSAVYAENEDTIIEYGTLLFDTYGNTEEFYNYCKALDVTVEEGAYTTFDYYANTVFMALYSKGLKGDAAKFAIKNINSYSDKSVLMMAMVLADPTNDKAFGDLLVKAYKSLDQSVETSKYAYFVRDMRQYKDENDKSVYNF